MNAGMDKEPLHARLRAAAFNVRTNARLSALLLEAAAAVPKPKGDEAPRRDTMAVLAAHHAAREDVKTSPMGPPQLAGARAAYGVDPLKPGEFLCARCGIDGVEARGALCRSCASTTGPLATCGHCGEEYARGATHCPECSARVA